MHFRIVLAMGNVPKRAFQYSRGIFVLECDAGVPRGKGVGIHLTCPQLIHPRNGFGLLVLAWGLSGG